MPEERKPLGYTAVFDEQDGSFTHICHGENEAEVQKKAESEYDNERIRVIPYYDNPFEVL